MCAAQRRSLELELRQWRDRRGGRSIRAAVPEQVSGPTAAKQGSDVVLQMRGSLRAAGRRPSYCLRIVSKSTSATGRPDRHQLPVAAIPSTPSFPCSQRPRCAVVAPPARALNPGARRGAAYELHGVKRPSKRSRADLARGSDLRLIVFVEGRLAMVSRAFDCGLNSTAMEAPRPVAV